MITQLSHWVQPTVSLLGFSLHIYGVLIGSAIYIGWILSSKRAHKYSITEQHLESVFLLGIIGGILGARIYHVVDQWGYYQMHLLDIFKIWNGGLGIFGALAGGLCGVIYAARIQRNALLAVLNLISPGVLLGQAIGRWGNFFNYEAFGPPTDLPWKIFIPFGYRPPMWQEYEYFHPVFLYESLLCLIGFFSLLILEKKSRMQPFPTYLVIYGFIRLFTESFRYDTAQISGIATATIISLTMIFSGVALALRNYKKI